jgi:hypothetical protein
MATMCEEPAEVLLAHACKPGEYSRFAAHPPY